MQNLQRILVPTDFSEGAACALIYAINLAEQICPNLYILHVDEEGNTAQEEIDKQFDKLRHHYLFNRKTKASFTSRKGNILDNIKKEVEESKIDLVVLGMVGARGTHEMMFGSITADLIERPPCTILAVPADCKILTAKHIAIASDNESLPNAPEMYVLNFISEALDSRVDIFHVTQNEQVVSVIDQQVKQSYNEIFKYNLHDFFEIKGENLVKSIKEYVESHEIDMLAVSHHLDRANEPHTRSISKQLAFSTKLPLLIIPVK